MKSAALASQGVNAQGFAQASKAMRDNSRIMRDGAMSTGMWTAEQLKLNTAADNYNKKLAAQKITFGEMRREWNKTYKTAYRDQLALQNMVVRSAGKMGGKELFDVYTPTELNKSLDTTNQRLGFLRENLRSASHQMINWGKNTQWAGRQLMVGLTMPVAAFGAAAGVMAYKIEDELVRIQKVYDTTAQAVAGNAASMAAVDRELTEVRAASLDTAAKAARDYAASGEDTLAVQADLAAIGLKGVELQKQTNEVMRIATLGELDRQTSTEMAISLQSVWRMSNEELADSFNYLNAIENATSLSTQDFATAIPIAAAPMKAWGGDIKELGILLTTMRERGIQAGKAANAIKATMQRLGRPSKQVREEFAALTGGDIVELVEQGTSLTEVFSMLNEATLNLSDTDKRKVFAGLFGSYQVTNMMAMTEGVGDLEKGIGQAAAAARIAGQETSEWASTADMEIERMMKSPGKRFKAAVEDLKLQMAEFGAPFLTIGTYIITVINKVLSAFNELPGAVKIAAGVSIGLMALAGPVIMLVGLFANLGGQAVKFGVTLAGLGQKYELLNKDSAAARLANELAEQGFIQTGSAVQQLTARMDALILSWERANAITRGQLGLGPAAPAIPHGPATAAGASPIVAPVMGGLTNAAGSQLLDRQGNPILSKMVYDTNEIEKNSRGIAKSWGTTGKLMGAASLAMVAGQVSSNETADGFANMAMNAAMAAGALSMFGLKMPKIGSDGKKVSDVLTNGMKSAGAGAKGLLGLIMKIPRAISWIARAFGPIGWAVAAITGGFLAIKNSMGQAEEDQKALNDAAASWADHLGYTKTTWGQIGEITRGVAADTDTMVENAIKLRQENPEIVEGYKEQDTAEGRNAFALTQYMTMRRTGADEATAISGINELFIASGMSIKEANAAMAEFLKTAESSEALGDTRNALKLIRTEMSLLESQKWLQEDTSDKGLWGWKNIYKQPGRLLDSMLHDEEEHAYEAGAGLAAKVEDGLSTLKNPFERAEFLDDISSEFNRKWTSVIDNINSDTMRSLSRGGVDVTQIDEMKQVLYDASNLGYAEFMDKYNATYNDWMRLSTAANKEARVLLEQERGLTETLRIRINGQGEAVTLGGLQVDNAGKILGITQEQAIAQYNNALAGRKQYEIAQGRMTWEDKLTKAQQLQVLNAERLRLGLQKTAVLADGFGPATRRWAQAQEEVNVKLDRARQLAKNIANDQITAATKDAMSSWQQAVADATMQEFEGRVTRAMEGLDATAEAQTEALEASSEAATERMEARHETAMERMERRGERAQRRLEREQEARRERIENSYDKRVEGIENTIKAEQRAEEVRKRIFEAEMQRVDRLVDSANRGIDFNVALNAGELDEAAKIRNDMEAQATEWALSDTGDRAARRSDRRTERLESRIDIIEENKDIRLDALAEVEEKERRSLERRLEREKKFLQKRQEAEKEFLQDQQEANRKALDKEIAATRAAEEKKWDARRNHTQKALDNFTGYIATSTRDLRRHIKIWEQEHKGLSLTTKGRFDRTADAINAYIKTSVTKAGKQIVNDVDWETNGWRIAKKMIKGAFGMSPGEFRSFIATGKPPKGWGQSDASRPDNSLNGLSPYRGGKAPINPLTGKRQEVFHSGGEVGTGGSGRAGYARTSRIHPNEVPVLAEKGEFMVNRKAASKNKSLLEAINNGGRVSQRDGRGRHGTGGSGDAGANLGMASMFGMMMSAALRRTVENGVVRTGTAAVQDFRAAQMPSMFTAGKAGLFGDVNFSASQLKHAATIASVGKNMGMTARDIQIGIMTAITESMLSLPNQAQSDRDSAGLFQQRPSQGWGTVAQVMDPEYAARKFFESLKGVAGRNDMSPWAAAQAVQRSAYSDGSNYQKYWDEAQAIFNGLATAGMNYAAGPGGWRPAAPRGLGWSNTHDYRAGVGTPLYAASDGTIIQSQSTTSGGSAAHANSYPKIAPNGQPYRSYGETVVLRTASGDLLRYAHLSPGTRIGVGSKVTGGTMIGKSGNTGNSSGPHVHFDVNGNYDALNWMRNKGIGLKKGGYTMSDGLANLHKQEVVISPERTKKLYEGIDRFATGGETIYNLTVNANQANATADDIAKAAVRLIERAEARKPKSRSSI